MFHTNFSNLHNIKEWHLVEETYRNNCKEFSAVENNLIKKYGFSKSLAQDAVLYEITSLVYRNDNPLKKINILSLVLFYALFLVIIVCYPLFFLYDFFKKKHSYDVVFEEMWDERSLYSRFYKKIHENIKRYSIGLFLTAPFIKKITKVKKIKDWNKVVVDSRNNNIVFDSKIVFRVIKNDFLFGFSLYKASSKDVDLVFLYLRLLRRILMCYSQVANLKSRAIISAVDYYWSPIKYFYYKKNIDNILLTQHNHKDNFLYGRVLAYCDYYFAHSIDSIKKMSINSDAILEPVGSLQLGDFLNQNKIKYDILFINQTVCDDLKKGSPELDQNLLIQSHDILIKNFKRYVDKHPDLNIVYMTKPTYMDIEPAKSNKQIFSNKNVYFTTAYGQETFSLVSNSKIIINMYSSVGREAYGLDKKVLWVNYNNCCDIFDLGIEVDDIHTLVSDNSYQAFEEKINLLLSDNKTVDKHYQKLKEKYMNIQGSPAKIVADKINELLK